ncbi:hypothetical protein Pelo_12638 [Pelomyxa schiedti]|nr:hypothetical protein Pelo_12638 [Pelomyxa schiedti]
MPVLTTLYRFVVSQSLVLATPLPGALLRMTREVLFHCGDDYLQDSNKPAATTTLPPPGSEAMKVGVFTKGLLAVALAYLLFPLDVIPDIIPLVGFVDDVVVISLLVGRAVRAWNKIEVAAENTDIKRNLCSVCLVPDVDVQFLPCRHECCCHKCASKITVCPLDCRRIEETTHLYHWAKYQDVDDGKWWWS